jgi:hypothetical protein
MGRSREGWPASFSLSHLWLSVSLGGGRVGERYSALQRTHCGVRGDESPRRGAGLAPLPDPTRD